MQLIKLFLWVATGCQLCFVGISAGAAVVGAGTSIIGGITGASASEDAAQQQQQAESDKLKAQVAMSQEAINANIRGSQTANDAYTTGYDAYNQAINAGYGAANQYLGDTYGRSASPAVAASGTHPEQIAQMQEQYQVQSQAAQQAQAQADAYKTQQVDKLIYSGPQSLPIIQAVQEQYNNLVRAADASKAQASQTQQQLQTARSTPYVPAQAARSGADTYDYSSGSASGKSIDSAGINQWLSQHPGASDAEIMAGMRQYGISASQMAAATGLSQTEIMNRIYKVQEGTNGKAPTQLQQGADRALTSLNAGYDKSNAAIQQGVTGGNALINAGLANSNKLINDGTASANAAIQAGLTSSNAAIRAAAEKAIGYQQPYYNAGTGALNQLTAGLKQGGQFNRQFAMSDYQADPGYQFRLDQGNKGIDNSATARGMTLSGATLKAISEYNSGQASQEFGNAFNRWNTINQQALGGLTNVAGMGQNAASNMGTFAANAGNQIGGNYMTAGQQTGQNNMNAGLATGQNTYNAGIATGGNVMQGGQLIGSNYANQGQNQASIYSNLGTNLANLTTDYAKMQSNNALQQQLAVGQNNLALNQFYGNNALQQADFMSNAYNQIGQNAAQSIGAAGEARAAGTLGQANAWNNALTGAGNALLQGAALYSNPGYNNLGRGYSDYNAINGTNNKGQYGTFKGFNF